MRKIDRVGQVFGELRVISAAPNKGRYVSWDCLCSCGVTKVIRGTDLQSGNTTSCGCMQIQKSRKLHTTHGGAGKRLYRCWSAMKARCNNPNGKDYPLYGGRGIAYAVEWEDYTHFEKWALLNNYCDDLTLERIDADEGYTPSNCEWVTQAEQTRNRRKQRAPASSQFIGVQFVKATQKWQALITHEGQNIYLGSFLTEDAAAKARDAYIIENNLTRYRINGAN